MSLLALPPSLPPATDDPARERALRAAREEYVWDWSWPPGCATLRRLPRRDGYGLEFIAKIAELQLRVKLNHAALAIEGAEDVIGSLSPGRRALGGIELGPDAYLGVPRTHPESIGEYARYFARLPAPDLVARLAANPGDADLLFAWQRVAGANPMSLRRITSLPEDLAYDPARWAPTLGAGSLAERMDAGRAFAVDYGFLHGVTTNRYLGRQKYLSGARAIFATVDGPLRPVAIQLAPGGRVFYPNDGVAWAMARFAFNVADANVHETMEHLGSTHMVMEALGIAARRQLAEVHPLRRLLEPHLVGTFAINESAKTNLIAPEGAIDRVFAARIDLAAGLVRKALDGFSLQDRAPDLELRARGLDDRDALPEFPYRDDVTRVYPLVARFADDYVRAYYRDDAAVRGDRELRAWVDEVGSPIGGNLRGVRPVETVAQLATWMANAIHVGSAQHAAVNFPQYPCFGWAADTAGACWGPPPGDDPTQADLLALMPFRDCAMLQTDSVYILAGVQHTRLGEYVFGDAPADEAAARFARDLTVLDETIAREDVRRRAPYPFLRPSQIPASVNI